MLKKFYKYILLFFIFFSSLHSEAKLFFPTYQDSLISSPFWSCEVLNFSACDHYKVPFVRKPVKVGFIDTGFNLDLSFFKFLNIERTYNSYINKELPINDESGHGTSVVSVFMDTIQKIESQVGQKIPIQFTLVKATDESDSANETLLIKAYSFMFLDSSIDIINISLAGQGYSINEHNILYSMYSEKEYKLMQYGYFKTNSLIVVPAGNRSFNLDKIDEYPCSYQVPSTICVGNLTYYNKKTSSNYGFDVDVLINGEKRRAISKDGKYNMLSGTSFSAPQISAYLTYARYFYPSLSRELLKEALIKAVSVKKMCMYAKSCGEFDFNEFKKQLDFLMIAN